MQKRTLQNIVRTVSAVAVIGFLPTAEESASATTLVVTACPTQQWTGMITAAPGSYLCDSTQGTQIGSRIWNNWSPQDPICKGHKGARVDLIGSVTDRSTGKSVSKKWTFGDPGPISFDITSFIGGCGDVPSKHHH